MKFVLPSLLLLPASTSLIMIILAATCYPYQCYRRSFLMITRCTLAYRRKFPKHWSPSSLIDPSILFTLAHMLLKKNDMNTMRKLKVTVTLNVKNMSGPVLSGSMIMLYHAYIQTLNLFEFFSLFTIFMSYDDRTHSQSADLWLRYMVFNKSITEE